MRRVGLTLMLGACQGPVLSPEAACPRWRVLRIVATEEPTLPRGCASDTVPYAVFLELRRDPLTGKPEWLSGHRYALAFYLEQLPVRLIVIESPWEDTLFFPRDAEAIEAWRAALFEWVADELLPFLRPYAVPYVAWGRSWKQAPLSAEAWREALAQWRVQDPSRRWGFCAAHPKDLPASSAWDFFGVDYQHFYPLHERPAYHRAWEATEKPLLLVYPNLFEPDTVQALAERQRHWHRPPQAILLESPLCP